MNRAILSAAVAIALTAGVSAQDKPNFAGKWKAANSFNSWTITVEGSRMTVTMTVAGNSESTVYLLDGTPSKKTFEGPNGPMENVSTSTWEGDVLVTTTKTAFGSTMIEKRSIQPDGTMRIQNALDIPGKPSPPPGPGLVLKKVVTGAAQNKPDFVGTWKPDPARSKTIGGLGPTQTIAVEGSKMTIIRTVAGNSSSTVYMLDGTPSKNTAGAPGSQREITYTSKWEGRVLVTTWTPSPLITDVERRSIEEDGTMKVEVTHSFNKEPGKSETSTRVFNKTK
jgi:hypothetical protein